MPPRPPRPVGRRPFTTFVGILLTDFAAYLDNYNVDIAADRVSYRQVPLWLTDEETDELITELRQVLARHTELPPDDQRRRHILTTVLMPDDRARHA